MRHPVINGVRLGLGVALIGTLLAETKLSNRGIGFLVIEAYSIFNMPQMYALLIILFVVAIGANTVIGRLGGLDDIKRLNAPSSRRVSHGCSCIRGEGRAAVANLPSHRDPYYAGKWQKPGGRYAETTDPGTGNRWAR